MNKSILFSGIICCLFSIFPCQLFAVTYYLDASNSRLGIGTRANPWQRVSSIRNIIPGDLILFKRGNIWLESLAIPTSNITVGAYGSGEQPILDMSLPVKKKWNRVNANIYSAPWPVQPGVLLYQGKARAAITTLSFKDLPSKLQAGAILLQLDDIYSNFLVTSAAADTVSGISFFTIHENKQIVVRQLENGREKRWASPLGIPRIIHTIRGLTRSGHWYWNDGRLYLYADTAPLSGSVTVADKAYGIHAVGKANLSIENITIHGAGEVGLFLQNTSNSTIRNIHILKCGSLGHKTGLLLFNSSNNLIVNNRIDSVLVNGIALYAENGQTLNNRINNNSIYKPGGGGITISSNGNPETVADNIIEENVIEHANALSYDGAGIYTLFSGSNFIQKNTIKNCGSERLRSAGIMADGGTMPLTIEANIIENNSMGGVAVSDTGHRISNNKLLHNGVPSWDNGQVLFFSAFANAENCKVTGNTMTAGPGQSLLYGAIGSTKGHIIDKNHYSSTNLTPFIWNEEAMSFTVWKQRTRQDTLSTFTPLNTSHM